MALIDRFVYTKDPDDLFSLGASMNRCRYRLFEWHSFQCSRKPTTEIDGFGFCTQHAKMIRERWE